MSNGTGRGTWTATNTLAIDLANTVGTLAINRGGTGSTTLSGLLYGDGAGNIISVANNAADWDQAYSWANAGHTDWDTAYSWGDYHGEHFFSTTTNDPRSGLRRYGLHYFDRKTASSTVMPRAASMPPKRARTAISSIPTTAFRAGSQPRLWA